jgi:hypothetical protein
LSCRSQLNSTESSTTYTSSIIHTARLPFLLETTSLDYLQHAIQTLCGFSNTWLLRHQCGKVRAVLPILTATTSSLTAISHRLLSHTGFSLTPTSLSHRLLSHIGFFLTSASLLTPASLLTSASLLTLPFSILSSCPSTRKIFAAYCQKLEHCERRNPS